MKNLGLRASWLFPFALAISGLVITGLGDSAPEAAAESAEKPVKAPQSKSSESDSGSHAQGATPKGENANGKGSVAASADLSKLSVNRSGHIVSKDGCLTDEAAMEDMQKLKAELEEKMKGLSKREGELQAREAALAEELKKMEAVRDEIKVMNQLSSGKNEEKVNRLAETFEAMAPKSAAAVVMNIDQALAVAALQKISSQKLAKILSAMDPNDSGAMTEALAGVVRVGRRSPRGDRSASHDAAGTMSGHSGPARRGGEYENGNDNSQQRQPASTGPSPATGQ